MSHNKRVFTFLGNSPSLKLRGLWFGKSFSREKIWSVAGIEAEGYFFSRRLNESAAMDRLLEIEDFSLKAGAGILGVDTLEDISGLRWEAVCAKLKIPVTSGKSLVAWSAYESIYRMARLKRIELRNTSVAVTGIGDTAAVLCCKKLSGIVKRLAIFDQDKDKLKRLRDQVLVLNPGCELITADTLNVAVKGADIILASGNLQEEFLCLDAVNPGGIICHILNPGMPQRKKDTLRRGCSVISAGLIKLPKLNNFRLVKGLAQNIVFASMAETMLLAIESKFTDYSGNEDTNVEKMEEIADIATRHGFKIWTPEAPLYF